MRAILDNPRYTGRQVWTGSAATRSSSTSRNVALGHEFKMRWNKEDAWVWSAERVHEPLVPDDLFDQARQLRAAAGSERPS